MRHTSRTPLQCGVTGTFADVSAQEVKCAANPDLNKPLNLNATANLNQPTNSHEGNVTLEVIYFAVCCSVLQCIAVCCSVLQCFAVRCSVLQCVAVCCSVWCKPYMYMRFALTHTQIPPPPPPPPRPLHVQKNMYSCMFF